MMRAPLAHVVHETRGRTRVRVRSKRHDPEYFEHARATLTECADVESVSANPITGSLLILHDSTTENILRLAQEQGLFVTEKTTEHDAALNPLQRRVAHFDEVLQERSDGRWGLKTLAFYGLLGAAVYQAYRGHVLPAAEALFQQALNLLDNNGPGQAHSRPAVPESPSI